MPAFNWRRMLKRWGDAMLASGEFPELAGAATAASPPATEAAIAAAEARLGVRLPPSYRAFLKVSNGWWVAGTAGPIRMWGVEQIGYLRDLDPELASIWGVLGGDDGDSADDPAQLPNEHLAGAIRISDDNDGFYLLNPAIEPEPGEWQAAFFANWVPGAECHPSFGAMMLKLCDGFIAAHPVTPAKVKPLNLAKPPAKGIDDPDEFLSELRRLGFFRYASDVDAARIERDYRATHAECRLRWHQLLDGPFASPGSAVFTPWSGRVANVETDRLSTDWGRYAMNMIRPLVAKSGVELGAAEELMSADAYAVRLEGVTENFFRLRKGRPAILGHDHGQNVAVAVSNHVVSLVNKVLKQRGADERISSLQEMVLGPSLGHNDFRNAFVLLDDPLSYLVMWTGAIGNHCRPLRPDVF